MKLKFGTDGIRGPVETHITPEACLKIGHATGLVMKEQGWDTVMIGKDTRVSGYMLESALQAGFIAAGVNVSLCGPLPTPGVAYLTKSLRRKFGVVISASHNNFLDNGIKIFNADGEKLSKDLEKKIEKLEQEIAALNEKLFDPEIAMSSEAAVLGKDIKAKQQDIDQAMLEWEQAQEILDRHD